MGILERSMVIIRMKDLFDLLPICMDCLRMSNSWPTHEPLMNGGILGILKDSCGFSGPLNTFKKNHGVPKHFHGYHEEMFGFPNHFHCLFQDAHLSMLA